VVELEENTKSPTLARQKAIGIFKQAKSDWHLQKDGHINVICRPTWIKCFLWKI